jgi:hypothetical protein
MGSTIRVFAEFVIMRRCVLVLVLAALPTVVCLHADEAEDKTKALIAEQKKRAEANWALLETSEFATLETDHFLIYAAKALEKKLKDAATLLESQYKTAREALKFPEKTEPWKGKMTVYLFGERPQFTAFIRRVEKRRLEGGETSSHNAAEDALHVAASPPQYKWDWPVEAQAAEQVASVLLERRVGKATPLPDWLVSGYGRATYYRHLPKDALTLADRRLAGELVAKKRRTAKDIWTGPLEADEAATLNAALADFFAFGPGAPHFEKLLEGFKLEENVEKKTMEQAIEKTRMNKDKIEPTWKEWVRAPK